jgi:hypothetical protein
MATWANMNTAPTVDGGEKEFAFEYHEELAAAGSTKDIMIPDDIKSIAVTAEAAGGGTSVAVYSTTDTVGQVKTGSGATWIAWGAGSIATATGSVFDPVTAIRMTQTGNGTSKITMRAQ